MHAACLQSGWLDIVSLVVIITNTAVMASQSYPGNPQWQVASDYLNVAFCFYFILELLVKLLGVGPRAFVRDKMNLFDALVVAASLVEVALCLMPGVDSCKCAEHSKWYGVHRALLLTHVVHAAGEYSTGFGFKPYSYTALCP